ncbi:MAG TPA: peptidase M22 [Syntrophomonadaceae bacterium]|nr:peptidase M22 [Syntrophomonadaceae bacterium]
MYYLGIDTSLYTTSLAVVDDKFNLIWEKRIPLTVEKGHRGLRQSEALFLHIKNLPISFEELSLNVNGGYGAIAVSSTPRPITGSYMPVFKVGESQAIGLSTMLKIPLYLVSHQEGHIMAGIVDNRELLAEAEFLAAHFSGGTSEFINVKKGFTNYFEIDTCFSGLDLHAGQLVDRVGVALGLPFPAGTYLEELALNARSFNISFPAAVKKAGFSFSGAETMAIKLINQGEPKEEIAYGVLRMIANTIEKAILMESKKHGLKKVLLVGGVMANALIRQRLINRLEHPAVGIKLFFARPELSTDNAVGVALLAMLLDTKHKR